ncbi:hypothetical protein K7W03_01050 [Sphingobium sp. PNB]|uniref:hypothetical protein n=1 Tax=Sphingobium sp. PNB TaxID=863934 RepID=UPI001CA3DE6B|nr:hypothetical protein [Sphingobium sp. PNB]MCB4858173.1 hypothetical protein [Sphingobium sp. PNB]
MPSTFLMPLLWAGLAAGSGAGALAERAGVAPVSEQGPFGKVPAVDSAALRSAAGMANLEMIATANNSGIVAGNSVNGQSVTGQIAIDGQSFQNMTGLSILTANTGNNVSINTAMNLNVSIQQ